MNDPSVFKVRPEPSPSGGEPASTARHGLERFAFRVEARSLTGMQKEAVVREAGPGGTCWRMVSDEGPYLNGTDLAPFPLGFFSAGLVFCFMTQLVRLARAEGITFRLLDVTQDTFYTMTGSLLRGDMRGGARPAEISVRAEADASPETMARLVAEAEDCSPAHALMRDVLANTFSLTVNGRPLPLGSLAPSPAPAADPRERLESTQFEPGTAFLPGIITKVSAAEAQHGVEGGAGTSLAPEQNRTLHVRAEARLLDGALMDTTVTLVKPLGSSFRFVCDGGPSIGGAAAAPPPLAYLAAGISFCYMTQLGRYAHVLKKPITVRLVQRNIFYSTGPGHDICGAAVEPVDTQVFLDSAHPDEVTLTMARMGEQTCFLHAAMRGSHRTILRAELNGAPLPLPAGPASGRDAHGAA